MAVGDDDGTLHILETPRNLQKQNKNERSAVSLFFEREARRLASAHERKLTHGEDKAQFIADSRVLYF